MSNSCELSWHIADMEDNNQEGELEGSENFTSCVPVILCYRIMKGKCLEHFKLVEQVKKFVQDWVAQVKKLV